MTTPSQTELRLLAQPHATRYDTATIMGGIYGDGIISRKGVFARQWVQELGEDCASLFDEALQLSGGSVARGGGGGGNRYYVEIRPERLRGFVDLVSHPWVVAVREAVLGPGSTIVEIGVDLSLPGASDEPWHRDGRAPEATLVGRRLNSLAFTLTLVDVFENMGPFEVAPGTQWDEPAGFEDGMFPPQSLYSRYEARAQRKMPKMGDLSARSVLTIHRGTANHSDGACRALVFRVDGADVLDADPRPVSAGPSSPFGSDE